MSALQMFEERILLQFCAQPGVTDVWLRENNTKIKAGTWMDGHDPWSSLEIQDFAMAAAANDQINLSRNPVATAYTPKGLRAQIQAPAASHDGWSVTIRRQTGEQPTLQDYMSAGAFDLTEVSWVSGPDRWKELLSQKRFIDFFKAAIDHKANFAVVGVSGAGKTRLLDALLQLLPKTEKVMLIEEGPEIALDHPLLDRGRMSAAVSGEVLLGSSQRGAVERVVWGEIIDGSAYCMVNGFLTLGGGMCSAHSASVHHVDNRLAFLARQHPAGLAVPFTDLRDIIATNLHVVISIKNDGSKRHVDEILVRG